MKVLVTGGAGFIGSHLVDRLIQEGHQVVVVDNLSTGKRKNINKGAIFYKMDILSGRLAKVFQKEKPEIVSHHAAQMDVRRSVADPIFDAQTNIIGLLNLLELAVKNGTRRILFASSGGAVYGEQEIFPAPESHPTRPLSPYGISKLSSEQYLYYYHKVCGLDYTALRYSNVYGPRQDPFGEAGVVAIFTQRMLKEEQPIINGNGMQTRDYIFVEDVVEANMAAIHRAIGGPFNVGTGKETSVNQLFRYLLDITGAQVKEIHGPEKKGEQARSSLDCQKNHKELDWEPRVSLQEGLMKTVDYFRQL
ncbi:MAG TPA: NAD-dependent epimerase/dehydratase family protein [Candidatus Manganitrophaceae bacterium]|nr:NAD-dependent epimerase/dehydratase family protein [Candidatus Manganitrophaceae bacterium]